MNHHKEHEQFYGTTTLGERGQVVIPAEARKDLDLGQSEKLLVFGMGKDMLVLTKLSQVEKIATHLASRLQSLREVLDKTK